MHRQKQKLRGRTCTVRTSSAASADALEQAMTTICHQRQVTPDGMSATSSAITAREVTAAASCGRWRAKLGGGLQTCLR